MNNAAAIYRMLVPAPAVEPKTPGQVWYEEYTKHFPFSARDWRECDRKVKDAVEASCAAVLAMASKPATEEDVWAAGCELMNGDGGWYIAGIIGRGAHWQYLRSDGTWTYDDEQRAEHPIREDALAAWGKRKP